jgi:hypothetical protein
MCLATRLSNSLALSTLTPPGKNPQYRGKEKEPTVILEAVATHDLWIWHAFFGLPGTLNDITVLD